LTSEIRKDASAPFRKYSAALNVCAGVAMGALAALYLVDGPREFREFMTTALSLPEDLTGEKPRLLIQAQNGLVNEPLPLGVAVGGASGGGIITIDGLPDGADLSLGSRSDRFGWTLPAADLEQTFVGAPTDFVGVMEPTATLRSASGKLLDRQAIRFEWRASKGNQSDRPPVEANNYETASAGAPAGTSIASLSPPQPAVAVPRPDTVGRASRSEAVAPKRGTRLKDPQRRGSAELADRKRSTASNNTDPILGLFSHFSRDGPMGVSPTRVQTQASAKSPVRRTEERQRTRPAR
jgi:hypothetical protein